jgi:hypothetical protein
MAKKDKKQAQLNPNLQRQDVEFSEAGVAQVNPAPAERAPQKRNKK